MNFVKVFSSEIANLGQRLVKVLRFGKSDVQTPQQCTPHGVDSAPVKDLVAVYNATDIKGQNVVLGYLNKECKAQTGDIRLYSLNASGDLQSYLWLKNDSTIDVNGETAWQGNFSLTGDLDITGNAKVSQSMAVGLGIDNAVKFLPLNTALIAATAGINANFSAIAASLASLAPPVPYTPVSVVLDISGAIVPELKVP